MHNCPAVMATDYERRRDASTFHADAARKQVASVLAGKTVDQWIASNPGTAIASFGLMSGDRIVS
jgi:hypothetical protein